MTHEEVHARAGEEEVEGDEGFHCRVRQIGEKEEEKQVGRVEESGLVVGGEGRTGVKGGIPEEGGERRLTRNDLMQCARGVTIGGPQE